MLESYRKNDALIVEVRRLELENAHLKELTELQFEALEMCYMATDV